MAITLKQLVSAVLDDKGKSKTVHWEVPYKGSWRNKAPNGPMPRHYIDSKIPMKLSNVDSSKENYSYWYFNRKFYETTDTELTSEDVLALINEVSNKRRLQLAKAHALQAITSELDSPKSRKAIGQEVKIIIWQRDKARCVECGSQENLEFDHIIPVSMGGANTARNLQLLCEGCNRRKGASLG